MARRGRLLTVAATLLVAVVAAAVPPTCERIECPAYEVVDSANGFEIRRYTDAMWITTAPIEDISFVAATRTGFLQLFNYIQGKNAYNETIEMTAPVLTRVSPSDGPFCASSFAVSFYVPTKNQADPPPAEGLRVDPWAGARYAAVRRFGGFVADDDVGEQAAQLDASLQGTRWAAAVNDARRADPASPYTVAQYNSPFEFSGRVNEIWMLFDDAAAAATNYKTALEEIHGLCRNTSASPALRYQSGRRATFAGNFSAEERTSFFSHTDDQVAIPCGFFREFPVPEHDRLAMEKCRGVVVASAIMNDYDKVRQPRGLGYETLRTACFFLFIDDATHGVLARQGVLPARGGGSGVEHTVGAWRVVTLGGRRAGGGRLPYEDPAMNGVVAKHLLHRLFPNARFSVWVDAKVQLTVDPALLVHALLVREHADVAVSRHPFNRHTMEEAIATARWRKCGDVDGVRAQMETYCANGLQPWSPSKLPYPSDVPDTAVIIRRHGVASDLFSCLLFNELEAFSPRDQLAFAYVRDHMSPKVTINMFEVEVFEQIAVEYRHNLKPGGGSGRGKQHRMASSRDIAGSSCERYLLKMWGESAD